MSSPISRKSGPLPSQKGSSPPPSMLQLQERKIAGLNPIKAQSRQAIPETATRRSRGSLASKTTRKMIRPKTSWCWPSCLRTNTSKQCQSRLPYPTCSTTSLPLLTKEKGTPPTNSAWTNYSHDMSLNSPNSYFITRYYGCPSTVFTHYNCDMKLIIKQAQYFA